VLIVVATYAIQRTFDVVARPREPNPATIVWSAHIAMFWRLNIGVFVAAMASPLVSMAAKANLDRTVRVLYAGVLAVTAVIAIQGLFMP
jgi:hypothetical protein